MKNKRTTTALLMLSATAFLTTPVDANTQAFASQKEGKTKVRIEYPGDQQLVMEVTGKMLTGVQIHVQKGQVPSKAVSQVYKQLTGQGLGYGKQADQVIGTEVEMSIPLITVLSVAPLLGQILNVLTGPDSDIIVDEDVFAKIQYVIADARSTTGRVSATSIAERDETSVSDGGVDTKQSV